MTEVNTSTWKQAQSKLTKSTCLDLLIGWEIWLYEEAKLLIVHEPWGFKDGLKAGWKKFD